MSKIVVDKMPEKPGDCPYNLGYLCGIKETPCKLSLQNPEPCDKLVGLDQIVAVKEIPSPAHRRPYYEEMELKVKENL